MERTLRLVQRCRRALLRATHEADLLQSVCEAAVEEGGYKFAWVGIAEQDPERTVKPVAQAGAADGYLDAVDIRWSDVPEGRGPMGSAIRSGQPNWIRFVESDPAMAPWKERALARGFLSVIGLPMSSEEGVFGALGLYAGVADAFDAEEVSLLSELADDLAFGLRALRTRLAHHLMALAVEQSPSVVEITDLDGNIEYVNGRFTELTGYTLDEVRGRNARILKSGRTSPEEYARLWKTVRAGGRWTGEFQQRRKDGSLYAEQAMVVPMHDGAGTIIKYLKMAEDVSQRNALEEQLRQSQKMEAVGRLAGGIAHDFNNTLMVIQGFTEMAIAKLSDDSPLRENLQQVMAAANRAAALTRQLMTFSRKTVIQPEIVDVEAVALEAAPMLRRLVGDDISLDVDILDTACVVLAERGQVDQFLLNLVVNARDAMPRGGALRIAVSRVTMDEAVTPRPVNLPPGTYVRMDVSDTGHGMAPTTQSRIFEPFFTTKAAGKGTGLGLSTVYAIVRQNSGAIDVTSGPGEGTTFHVWLPIAEGQPGVASALPDPAGELRGSESILIVDDAPAVCEIASRILKSAGFEVLTAVNPGEALLIGEQRRGRLDLLLSDVVMPQINGRELGQRLAQMIPGLKILFMSGYADDVLSRNDVTGREVQLMRKPFDRETLLRRVRGILDLK